MSDNAFTLTVDANGIARLVFDLPNEKVNKFSAPVMMELDAKVSELAKRTDIKAMVFASGKSDIFIAGADINEILAITTEADALAKAKAGQDVFNKIEALPFPTIAVIDGACLGGGLECAMSCTYRIATDSEKTSLGLPEVNLGIIPGWGGTQRMPRLIGVQAALDLILAGKPVNGPKSLKLHLSDACFARAFLDVEVPAFIASILTPEGKAKVLAKRVRGFNFLENNPAGRAMLFSGARKVVIKKTRGKIPAPLKALEVIEHSHNGSLADGLRAEAQAFAKLAPSSESKCLVDCFFAGDAIKKEGGKPTPGAFPEIKTGGVLGAGVMGGGIAWLMSHNGMPVRLKDISWEAIAKGYKTASEYNEQLTKLRKMTPNEASLRMHRISGGIDFTGFNNVDLVIEAVVENLDVKKKVFAELEDHVRDSCIIATNTSSLCVTDMATALKKPERFVGMHFFNPVNRMPLLEVVAGEKSSKEAVSHAAAIGRKLGKTVVVVKDCPGFLVNRILLPYMNEAAWILQEGGEVQDIDQVIYDFGMPMGPFRLTDEVGIDVGYKVAKILADGYGERMKVAEVLKHINDDLQLKGVKGGEGFYVHGGKEPHINPDIHPFVVDMREELGVKPREFSHDDILDRCMLIMVNESARCIEENVVSKPAFLDLAMVMGTGFPPYRGGPLHYANSRGIQNVVDRLDKLRDTFGPRFEAASLLRTMAKANQTFTLH